MGGGRLTRLIIAGIVIIAVMAGISVNNRTDTEKGGADMMKNNETNGTPLDRVPENTAVATFALG